jgi:hypothetical protein
VGIGVEHVKTDTVRIPVSEATPYDTLPTRLRTLIFNFTIYRLVASATDEEAFRIDVGSLDEFHVSGFHDKERLGASKTTFRWTADRSRVSMPPLKPEHHELVLRVSAGRPGKAAPARFTVFLADQAIGTAEPAGEFRDYTFAIPADLAATLARQPADAEVRIESTTWTPRDVLGGADDRALGIMIDRVEIR